MFVVYKIWEAIIIERKNKELAMLNNKLEQANEELAYLSEKDALTGLYNRRSFDKMLENKLQLAKKRQTRLSILMMDIDRFKDINDKFGHVAADQYLINIAQKLKDILPQSTDFAARYGGNEFAIVLFDMSLEGAKKVAKIIKECLNEITIHQKYIDNQTNVSASVSIGLLSIIPNNSDNILELIQAADRALYKAKEEGRDRIKIADLSLS